MEKIINRWWTCGIKYITNSRPPQSPNIPKYDRDFGVGVQIHFEREKFLEKNEREKYFVRVISFEWSPGILFREYVFVFARNEEIMTSDRASKIVNLRDDGN